MDGLAAESSGEPGSVAWLYQTGGRVSSPAIGADGTVYVESGDMNFYALNPDGTEKWHFDMYDAFRTSPAIGA
ncbi:MAG: PQQ-binding-like beta-propeller repeat protein, partial [Gemmatimonadales bacterium]|nr:PQQ-binding-like beta-propeller repeat protein [Gemmatimonadales bacterium]